MKFDFTEGEWYVQRNADVYTHIVRINKDKGFEKVFLCQLAQDSSGESRANAQLISCAPEMLSALIEYVMKFYRLTKMAHIKNSKYEHQYKDNFYKQHKKEINLIEKATGKKWEEINNDMD